MDRHAKPKTFCKQNMTQYFFALCKSRLQRYHIGQEQGKLSITDPEKACLQACFVCEGFNFGLAVSKEFPRCGCTQHVHIFSHAGRTVNEPKL